MTKQATLGVRLEGADVARLDALAARWPFVNRSVLARVALRLGLAEIERRGLDALQDATGARPPEPARSEVLASEPEALTAPAKTARSRKQPVAEPTPTSTPTVPDGLAGAPHKPSPETVAAWKQANPKPSPAPEPKPAASRKVKGAKQSPGSKVKRTRST